MHIRNLFLELPAAETEEAFEELLQGGNWRLERIVSRGQATPAGEWLAQPWTEWVLLLAGAARLTIAGEPAVELRPGDAVIVLANARHRVDWTDPAVATIWLALHYDLDLDEERA
jgi:cupin 2 domain-containing protein